MADAWAGLVYTSRNTSLRGLGISVSTVNVANGLFFIGLPVLVLSRLGGSAAQVGQLFALMGVTAAVSVLVVGRTRTEGRERPLLAGAMIFTGLGYGLVILSPNLLFAALAMALIGLATGPFDVVLFTLRQRRTDPAWLGRAFAVSMSFNFIGSRSARRSVARWPRYRSRLRSSVPSRSARSPRPFRSRSSLRNQPNRRWARSRRRVPGVAQGEGYMFRLMVLAMVLALTHMASNGAAAVTVTCPQPSPPPARGVIEMTVTIMGTEGDDVIRGTEGRDVIAGLGGNDRIWGLGGNDLICGGLGDDWIDGGNGNDFILGDTGDTFRLGFPAGFDVPGGDDVILGSEGDDGLAGEGGKDQLRGGDGNDFATGQMGDDNVFGDDGVDDLFGGPGHDVVHGGDGDDFLVGNFGNDVLLGGKGDDQLFGDAFFGDPGAFDVCNGQQGFDRSATCEVNNQMEGDLTGP